MSKKSIDNLQKALGMEMTAVQQYLLHAYVLEDWGLDRMASRMREEMQEELGHAGKFINRILFLGGEPKVTAIKAPKQARTLEELFTSDLKEEEGAVKFYTEAAGEADAERDIGTRVLFESIVLDEEGHMEWLSLQLDLLKRMGEPAYTARHMTAPGDEQHSD
jgi:bacterioferritin